MDLFGIFKKKKKPQVKSYPAPKANNYTKEKAAAVGKYLEPRLRKDQASLKGDANLSAKKINARFVPNTAYSPTQEYKKKLKMMSDRAV